jgi:predicted nucleotidyltransferase
MQKQTLFRIESTRGAEFRKGGSRLDKKTVIDIITQFARELQISGIYPQRIILFGSQAAGTATEASDIDVVVISDGFSGKDYWERIDILAEAIYAVYAPLEAIAMTPDEWENSDSLIIQSARKGEVLFAA